MTRMTRIWLLRALKQLLPVDFICWNIKSMRRVLLSLFRRIRWWKSLKTFDWSEDMWILSDCPLRWACFLIQISVGRTIDTSRGDKKTAVIFFIKSSDCPLCSCSFPFNESDRMYRQQYLFLYSLLEIFPQTRQQGRHMFLVFWSKYLTKLPYQSRQHPY